jgi:hypothetical protein
MRATEAFIYKNQGPGDTPVFNNYGGIYQIVVVGFAAAGSATLYELGPDGVTWLCVHDAFMANGGDTIYLPPGHYKWTIVGEANISVGMTRVPGE